MSAVAYNPALFAVQRKAGGGSWVTVPAATLTWTSDYNLADHTDGVPPSHIGTLVIGSETATVSYSRWDEYGSDILYPADTVRARYNGEDFFLGTVESVTVTSTADPAARAYGKTRRIDVECAVAGYYASLLSTKVPPYPGSSDGAYPRELWIDRIRHWVSVAGW